MNPRLFSFVGGSGGPWEVTSTSAIAGETLEVVEKIAVIAGLAEPQGGEASWILQGATSNERYVTLEEKRRLVSVQAGLGRKEATLGALIPIRKSQDWWELPQGERRAILAENSRHIEIGLDYLPPIARRLFHCRDLTEDQPFDFLTWFEFEPMYEQAFDELVARLRDTPEWKFVDREVDIRLRRD
ncbi:chlorite dismutase family protein [Paraburkholderia caribensis]|uniref:chlorite dismutase family protein n=1 Tax=Paraburkholderia caribensis TaxID=75105 RepID=UPI001CB65CBD|nr:chlorite dismutase family protein [Paraburkholderia caribensis]CAG9249477.1 conserved hypothetical protein [Paraburkholderia caribensis]